MEPSKKTLLYGEMPKAAALLIDLVDYCKIHGIRTKFTELKALKLKTPGARGE